MQALDGALHSRGSGRERRCYFLVLERQPTPAGSITGSGYAATGASPPSPSPKAGARAEPELTTMSVAQAVMVTVELDFGSHIPSIAEALKEIARGYAPDGGQGRTFSILDAYGEPTPDGKLHLSMHVSSEKPGRATLTFKRTGDLLWRARIGQPTDAPAPAKNLMISLDNGAGRSLTLDGSRGGPSVLDVMIKDATTRVRDLWPDGAEREVTFVYSACGCPVKVMAKRAGEKTVRTKDTPVIFPDDPAAVSTISQLMGWENSRQ